MQSPLEVKQHPIDLRMHGVTPGGLSLYRVVWADSRTSRLYFEGRVHEFGRYEDQPNVSGKWILEKWLTAQQYIGMSRDQYEAFMDAQVGAPKEEYPVDGEYELDTVYPGHVDEAATHAYIAKQEWRLKNFSLAKRKAEVRELAAQHEVEKKAEKVKVIEEIVGRGAPKEEVGRIYV